MFYTINYTVYIIEFEIEVWQGAAKDSLMNQLDLFVQVSFFLCNDSWNIYLSLLGPPWRNKTWMCVYDISK